MVVAVFSLPIESISIHTFDALKEGYKIISTRFTISAVPYACYLRFGNLKRDR